ncbi:plant invertase/pectin methylesterase inhibitor, partial [Striga asiatica]
MADAFRKFPLAIALTFLLQFSLPFPPIASAAAHENPLATQVCRNTTDFDFCRRSIYSDPHAPTADRAFLAVIIFTNAFLNATDTRDHIAARVKSGGRGGGGGGDSGVARGLRSCLRHYDEAIRAVSEVLGDLNDDTFYDFDKLSLEAESNARACESGFHGRSPITPRNEIFIKLAEICGDGRGSAELSGLKGCLADYTLAVQTLKEVLGDLDSETYYEFDVLSNKSRNNVATC